MSVRGSRGYRLLQKISSPYEQVVENGKTAVHQFGFWVKFFIE